jgi:hypothetical protein
MIRLKIFPPGWSLQHSHYVYEAAAARAVANNSSSQQQQQQQQVVMQMMINTQMWSELTLCSAVCSIVLQCTCAVSSYMYMCGAGV